MTNRAEELCLRLARRQRGLLSVAQALECGLTDSAIKHRVRQGRFERGPRGMLRIAGAPRTLEQRLLEALHWAGDGAALSHRCAAARWHIDPIETKMIELTTPRNLRRPPTGVTVHKSVMPVCDVGTLRGVRVTSPARTVVDLAGVIDDEALEIALDCVLAKRMTTIDQIERALSRAGSRGRVGIRRLRRMLTARTEGKPLGMSPLEVRFLRLLRREGVSLPLPQFEVHLNGRRYVIDYAYPVEHVAIELDGYRWHSSPDRLVSDRRKSNAVTLAGYQLLRFTDPDVKLEPLEVVKAVLSARGIGQLRF